MENNKPNAIAKPDVLLVAEFMTPEMLEMIRPTKQTVDWDRLPIQSFNASKDEPLTKKQQKQMIKKQMKKDKKANRTI